MDTKKPLLRAWRQSVALSAEACAFAEALSGDRVRSGLVQRAALRVPARLSSAYRGLNGEEIDHLHLAAFALDELCSHLSPVTEAEALRVPRLIWKQTRALQMQLRALLQARCVDCQRDVHLSCPDVDS